MVPMFIVVTVYFRKEWGDSSTKTEHLVEKPEEKAPNYFSKKILEE